MRLLDRLDAIDRRLGLAPNRPPRKPPNRFARWVARHRWAYALIVSILLDAVWALTGLLLDGESSIAGILVAFPFAFAVGLYTGTAIRNQCEEWDRRTADATPEPEA